MPISIRWDNAEKTIIYIRYERWTWDDFYNALAESAKLSSSVNHQVDIIADLVDNVVPKGGTFSHAAATLKQDNEKVGLIILVTPNRFIQALTQMSSRIIPGFQKKYRIVNTVEQAYQMLGRERNSRSKNMDEV